MSFVRYVAELLALFVAFAISILALAWIAVMLMDWIDSDHEITFVRFAGLRLADAWRILRRIV